jgi:hypothetical protein
MIGVELQGRLGNQLFQYAFAYATAKKLKTSFYFDRKLQALFLPTYFNHAADLFYFLYQTIFSIGGFNGFFKNYLKLRFYAAIRRLLNFELVYISDQVDPRILVPTLKNNKMFSGYFQAAYYFEPYKTEILERFSLKRKHIIAFEEKFKALPKGFTYVVVHIRRTDYIDYNIQLVTDYYHNAIAAAADDNNFYILISDDVQFVKEEFSYLKNKYISAASEIIDFQFLMNADICILSNSTFSWWGAYLNKKNKKVFAPKYWFPVTGEIESPCDIFIADWILVDF